LYTEIKVKLYSVYAADLDRIIAT